MNKITWIISTGNSDIQILNHTAWNGMLLKYKNSNPKYKLKNPKPSLNPKFKVHGKSPYLLEARVLGAVTQSSADYEKLSLTFPLLKGFIEKLKDKSIKPDRIIFFLTDQDFYFNDKDKLEMSCPFWQDTCEAESIFKWYFEIEGWLQGIEAEFKVLIPTKENGGLSNWNNTLSLLKDEFKSISWEELEAQKKSGSGEKIKGIYSEEDEIFYVSHQAGTPAISSALQFVSLNRFGDKVKFLVSNEFEPDTVQILESSEYLKYLFIGQAKELLKKGNPAAALQLLNGLVNEDILTDINKQVKVFNLKSEDSDRDDEFEPLKAAERVRDALDLIDIFLRNENYLEAIALLSAAHETFLKAAVQHSLSQWETISQTYSSKYSFSPLTVLKWTNQGLKFVHEQQFDIDSRDEKKKRQAEKDKRNAQKYINQCFRLTFPTNQAGKSKDQLNQEKNQYFKSLKQAQLNFLESLDFPIDKVLEDLDKKRADLLKFKSFDFVGANNALVTWVKKISDINIWKILDWIGTRKRPFEDDLRNQMIHNLRGIEKEHLKQYLSGFDGHTSQSVIDIFTQEVRSPFIQAMYQIGLIESGDTDNYIQKELKKLSDRLT